MRSPTPPTTDQKQDEFGPRSNDLLMGKHWELTNIGEVVTGYVIEIVRNGGWYVQFSHNGFARQMPLDDFLNNAKSLDQGWRLLTGDDDA
jgi:hypothetical protein